MTVELRTAQETFDTVVTHLLRQGAKSTDGGLSPRCLYRGPNGRRCAVGSILPDEAYVPELEGLVAIRLPETVWAAMRIQNRSRTAELLQALQSVHDTKPVESWPVSLQWVAWIFDVSGRVIQELTGNA